MQCYNYQDFCLDGNAIKSLSNVLWERLSFRQMLSPYVACSHYSQETILSLAQVHTLVFFTIFSTIVERLFDSSNLHRWAENNLGSQAL